MRITTIISNRGFVLVGTLKQVEAGFRSGGWSSMIRTVVGALAAVAGSLATAGVATAANEPVTVTGTFTPIPGQAAEGRSVIVSYERDFSIPDRSINESGGACHDFWYTAQPWSGTTEANGLYTATLTAPPSDCPSLEVSVFVRESTSVGLGPGDFGDVNVVFPSTQLAPGSAVTVDVAAIENRTIADVQAEKAAEQAAQESQAAAVRSLILIVVAVLLLGLLVFLAHLVAAAAQRKGRNYWPWFWIAFVFLIPAAIIVAIMKNESADQVHKVEIVKPVAPSPFASPASGAVAAEADTKWCPFCGETILFVAKKCKHCGEFLEA